MWGGGWGGEKHGKSGARRRERREEGKKESRRSRKTCWQMSNVLRRRGFIRSVWDSMTSQRYSHLPHTHTHTTNTAPSTYTLRRSRRRRTWPWLTAAAHALVAPLACAQHLAAAVRSRCRCNQSLELLGSVNQLARPVELRGLFDIQASFYFRRPQWRLALR